MAEGVDGEGLDPRTLVMVIESLLFVSGEPVSASELEKTLGAGKAAVEEALEALEAECAERGVRIQQHNGRWQMITAPEAAAHVEKFLGLSVAARLSAPALDSLAIVAYQQPVTRHQIEAIRGVDSSGVLNTLQARGLIEEVGRLETVGRPILYGTTFEFLRHFGLSSLQDLPRVDAGAVADAKGESS